MKDHTNSLTHEQLLRCVLEASAWFNEESSGGAHTEVRRIDPDALMKRLEPLAADPASLTKIRDMAEEISARFLLKRGKIQEFKMRLVGDRENTVKRSTASYAFGPVGYNLHPSLEKTRIDVADAVRLIPYFGAGGREAQVVPDLLEGLRRVVAGEDSGSSLSQGEPFLLELGNSRVRDTIYDIAGRDPYFREPCTSWAQLQSLQKSVRTTPLSREMEDRLRRFFDAPITVGWRDMLRYAKGSRHPDFGWSTARALISGAFSRWGDECFLLPEISYYAADLDPTADEVAARRATNEQVVKSLSKVLSARLPRSVRHRLSEDELYELTWDLLEFHHDYPVYQIEPYQGLLSVSMARLMVRASVSAAAAFTGLGIPERRNRDMELLAQRPVLAATLMQELKPRESRKLLAALDATLALYVRRGATPDGARFKRIERTFYTFQQRADYDAGNKGTLEKVLSLEELWEPENVGLLDQVPELAEKLLVFFVLSYRYYVETGFFPDFRPRNAGRDIFIYGIWGYLTDNVLVMSYRRKDGSLGADVRYVDNRDQFKEYRRIEDRDSPVGMARTALRLTSQVTEPSMRRSIGIFADQVRKRQDHITTPMTSFTDKVQSRGLDMLQAVAHDVVEQVFENTRSVVDDVVDDLFEGVRQAGMKLERTGVLPARDVDQ